MNRVFALGLAAGLVLWCGTALLGQNSLPVSSRHPAIAYSSTPTTDPVSALNQRILDGQAQLAHDPKHGYLRSVLTALGVPVESQMLVFSETSLQSEHITRRTPRALYFNDSVAVGWVPGTDTLEISAFDSQQGVIFYQLDQTSARRSGLSRSQRCLECHESAMNTAGIAGLLTMSMLPLSDDPNEYAVGWPVDHRTPVEDRWGGWFVTGEMVPRRHLGNVPVYHVKKGGVRAEVAPRLASVAGDIDATAYLTPYSDVAALLVFNHQTHITNLLIRLNWVARVAEFQGQAAARGVVRARAPTGGDRTPIADAAAELVDYMLFVDEPPLPAARGNSGFTEKFAAMGPRDSKGRSLRNLQLQKRLFTYPCSYMIYSPAFDALPARAKAAVYDRLWEVLSGKATDRIYARLSAADRQAVIEILRDTKKDLPPSFR